MRVSKERATQNRQEILTAAARLLRDMTEKNLMGRHKGVMNGTEERYSGGDWQSFPVSKLKKL